MFDRASLIAALLLSFRLFAPAQDVTIEKVEGQSRFTIECTAITDLSGITWTGGDQFFAVADHPNVLVPITLQIDRARGSIGRGEFGALLPVRTPPSDFESVTYRSASRTFYIAAEWGNAVVRFRPGTLSQFQPVPPIYKQNHNNLGLESITWNDTAGHFWIANEEALEPDGPLSGATGTVVRLQQLDAELQPLAQFAWRTEPAAFRFRNTGNGVADLCLLPDGRLLVLERGFAFNGLRLRIFVADFTGATEISKMPALAGANISLVKKTLLYEEATGFFNFEGLTLGPALDDGSRSLIVVADSNGGSTHSFLPLKLRLASPPAARDAGPQSPEVRGALRENGSR